MKSRTNIKASSILAVLVISMLMYSCGGTGSRIAKDDLDPASKTKRIRGSDKSDDGASGFSEARKKESTGRRGRPIRRKSTPGVSGLKAGFVDDNSQFNRYLEFLKKFKYKTASYPVSVDERLILKVKDVNNRSVPNVAVKISSGGRTLYTGKTYADGSLLFFPSEYDKNMSKYTAQVNYNQVRGRITFSRDGRRDLILKLNTPRSGYGRVPIDILFIFDTTGSMGEEIARLKQTIEIIYLNLSQLSSNPLVRFGMVLYKDKKDAYVTKIVPFTEDIDDFKKSLNEVGPSGGGDYPEDLQSALSDSMKKMKWKDDGIRLGFIITDAPPHIDYNQNYTYIDAIFDARRRAIKIFSIGTGGLNVSGEYVLRQIAQYTSGKYIFLTYGEKGESEGGRPGSVSHHTGANFQTGKLESIIIRFAKKELSYLTDKPIEDGEGYFEAQKVDFESKKETLAKLFDMSLAQLIDFSSIAIPEGSSIAVLPVGASKKSKQAVLNAEYFTEELILSVSRNRFFKMVERKDLQKIINEISIQMSGLIDPGSVTKVGKMTGAEMLLTGQLYKKKGNYELFIKLLRVKTGEVLSVTRAKIASSLGL